MSAVDTPPGLGLGGLPLGAFAARPGPRRLAEYAARIVLGLALFTIALATRHPGEPRASVAVVGALTTLAIAGLGIAVRRAQVTIGAGGVSWGWGRFTVRMDRDRIARVDLYDDALALRPRRGSAWFLSRRDWDRFEAMRRALAAADLPTTEHARRAPLTARLQSYGRVLDGLLILATLAAAALAALMV